MYAVKVGDESVQTCRLTALPHTSCGFQLGRETPYLVREGCLAFMVDEDTIGLLVVHLEGWSLIDLQPLSDLKCL